MAITKLRVRGRAGLLGLVFGEVEPAFGAKARFLFVLLAATGTVHGFLFLGQFYLGDDGAPASFFIGDGLDCPEIGEVVTIDDASAVITP